MLFRNQSTARSPRLLAPRLGLVAYVVAGFIAAGAAEAQRRCEQDAAITGRTCTVEVCLSLQAAVNNICKNPAPESCAKKEGCNKLRREKTHWLNCGAARDSINKRCWGGGDLGHQIAVANVRQNVGLCSARIALPEPVGCADPCPQISDTQVQSLFLPAEVETVTHPTRDATMELLIPILKRLAAQGLLQKLLEEKPSAESPLTSGTGDEK